MAKKNKDLLKGADVSFSDLDFAKALVGELKTINPYADLMSEENVFEIEGWIDTGIMALNMILSGSFRRGMPTGRIMQLYGESQSGKSLITSMISANAQKDGYIVALIESEFGEMGTSLVNKGLDPKRTIPMPVKTVEQWYKCMLKIIELKAKHPTKKILIILDSLGNLTSEYALEKFKEGKSDMGHKQKAIREIFRNLTYELGINGIPFIFTNHIYEDSSGGLKSKEKNAGGGHGAKYLPTITCQFGKGQQIKQGDKKIGVNLKAYTIKNRIVPAYQEVALALNFTEGFKKYTGLVPLALQYGLLEKTNSARIAVPHMKGPCKKKDGSDKYLTFWEKDLEHGEKADKVWEPILDKLEEYVLADNAYFSSEVAETTKAELEEANDSTDSQ